MNRLAQTLADGTHDFGHMGWGNGGWWMMIIWAPIVFIGLVALVIWAVRSTSSPPRGRDDDLANPLDGARRILAERYARGELDSDEYQERLEHLR